MLRNKLLFGNMFVFRDILHKYFLHISASPQAIYLVGYSIFVAPKTTTLSFFAVALHKQHSHTNIEEKYSCCIVGLSLGGGEGGH